MSSRFPLPLHSWDLPPKEAVALQRELSLKVETSDRLGDICRVAGVDIGFPSGTGTTRAAIAVLSFPELELVESSVIHRPTSYPYVPGLLSFREIPAALEALEKLRDLPDLLLCDGHGIAHPRRFGIAAHLGLVTGLPSLGVGKSRLTGRHAEPGLERGDRSPLKDRDGEVIGTVLRTRARVKPVFISPGHRISLETAVSYALACTTKYRLPETTRHAHRLASGP